MMKVLKFPKDRVTKPRWRMWLRNVDKRLLINKLLSWASLLVGLAIVLFVIYSLNRV